MARPASPGLSLSGHVLPAGGASTRTSTTRSEYCYGTLSSRGRASSHHMRTCPSNHVQPSTGRPGGPGHCPASQLVRIHCTGTPAVRCLGSSSPDVRKSNPDDTRRGLFRHSLLQYLEHNKIRARRLEVRSPFQTKQEGWCELQVLGLRIGQKRVLLPEHPARVAEHTLRAPCLEREPGP